MKRISTAVLLVAMTFSLSGCNAYQRAETVEKIVASVLAIAEAEVSQFPQNEQATISGYIAAGVSLNAAYGACIDNANQAMIVKSAKFLDCLGIFSKALNDPQLLAQLRVLNPNSTRKIQRWLTAVSLSVNEAIVWFGGQAPQPSSVGAPPTSAELREFKQQVLNGM